MLMSHTALQAIGRAIFAAVGCAPDEAANVARRLVMSNLVGHDSHGVIRIPQYIESVQAGETVPNQSVDILFESEAMAMLDGRWGFGQTVGEQSVSMAIDKARKQGIGMSGLRFAGHVGRLGDWAEMAAEAGMNSIHCCNTVGVGPIVAPAGGRDRRLATNPLAMGSPVDGGDPVILDFATATIAEGKARVARNKGETVPEGSLIDADGKPSIDPNDLYADPPGALLPFGGFKGSGLSFMVDLFSGALTAGRSTFPRDEGDSRACNNMVSIVINPAIGGQGDAIRAEIQRFAGYVRSSRPRGEGQQVLLPGEPERRTRADRTANGIPVDEATFEQIVEVAGKVGVTREAIEALIE